MEEISRSGLLELGYSELYAPNSNKCVMVKFTFDIDLSSDEVYYTYYAFNPIEGGAYEQTTLSNEEDVELEKYIHKVIYSTISEMEDEAF